MSYVHLNPIAANIVSDPADYQRCGHSENLGLDEPVLIYVPAVLRSFDDGLADDPRDLYLSRIRHVAGLRWIDQGIRELPWWKSADNLDEIASPATQPESRPFDDRALEDERVVIDVEEFTALFERRSGHTFEGLRSPLRHPQQVRARVEFATVAAARYGIRSTKIADSTRKHPTTIARLTGRGRTRPVT